MRKRKSLSLGIRLRLVLLLATVLLCGLAIRVGADVFTVTNTDDDGPGSLRDAIAQANAVVGADEIVFDPALNGQTISLSSDQLTITDDLVITGLGEENLTVARDPGAPDFRVFEIDDGLEDNHLYVSISGLTISGGKVVSTEDSIPARGGGVLNREWLVVRDATVTDNRAEATVTGLWDSAEAYGGGIESSHWLVLENTTISDNTAHSRADGGYGQSDARGGGVRAEGYLVVDSSRIVGNNAVGAGFALATGGGTGGGIVCADATISKSTIAANTARGEAYYAGASGGGIFHSGELRIVNSSVTTNVSHGDGQGSGSASGGGTSGSGPLTVRSSTVSGNRALANDVYFYPLAKGGGLSCSAGTIIRNSTIASNTAWSSNPGYSPAEGGGAHLPFARLESTIISNNTANDGPDLKCSAFTVVTHNLIGDPSASSVPIGVDGNITGDPQLGALQDNGGPTETRAIPYASLAVDSGANPAGLETDQRGYWPRDHGGAADIGAFEHGAVAILFADDFESTSTGAWTRVRDVISVTLPGGESLQMARVPAGAFSMGAHGAERGAASDEYPHHQVTLTRDFYLGTFEVTQAQWLAIMGSNPAHDHGVGDDHPVYFVSWAEIAGTGGFIDQLNQHLTNTGQPGAGLYRLPTEAEWEHAARARTVTRFSFGDALECSDYCQPCDTMGGHMWWCGNASETMPVGSRNANLFGLWDMHGNVWEWVADWYGSYPLDPQVDPTGSASGSFHAVRGGGWSSAALLARSAARKAHAPAYISEEFGFRLARDLE